MGNIPLYLSVASSIIGIISGPVGLYFSYKASKSAGHAVTGADELARRMNSGPLFNVDKAGTVQSVRTLTPPSD